jgi:plasmid maintenance system antidote protein VapI
MSYNPSHTRLPIPVGQLIKEYKTNLAATSYSLAAKYGFEQRHISRLLHDNMDANTRKELECEKKSYAMSRKWSERKKAQ